MIVHIQSNLRKQWEEFACSELSAALQTSPRVISQCACASSTLQWLNLIKNVLTTLQYSGEIFTYWYNYPLAVSKRAEPPLLSPSWLRLNDTFFLGDCCRVKPWRRGSGNSKGRNAALRDHVAWRPPQSLSRKEFLIEGGGLAKQWGQTYNN